MKKDHLRFTPLFFLRSIKIKKIHFNLVNLVDLTLVKNSLSRIKEEFKDYFSAFSLSGSKTFSRKNENMISIKAQ